MSSARRHRCQMTTQEIEAWEAEVQKQTKWSMGAYAACRAGDRGISLGEVLETLEYGYVVEVNRLRGLCLVMRRDFADYSVCVVVAVPTRFVITCYKNDVFDVHDSLDMSQYQLQPEEAHVRA